MGLQQGHENEERPVVLVFHEGDGLFLHDGRDVPLLAVLHLRVTRALNESIPKIEPLFRQTKLAGMGTWVTHAVFAEVGRLVARATQLREKTLVELFGAQRRVEIADAVTSLLLTGEQAGP